MEDLSIPNTPEEEINQANPTPIHDGNPYFMGDHALIRFSAGEEGLGPDTFWLVDKSNHTIRPFESHMAMDAVFGEDLKDALKNAMTVATPQVDGQGNIVEGVLSDFTLLSPEYAIKEDGTSKPLHFSTHQLRSRYGKPVNESLEQLATEAVDGFLGLLKTNEDKTNIPGTFINKLKSDHQLMAFYISSLAYGDYTLGDIYSDIHERFNDSNS